MTHFNDFGLNARILQALAEKGYDSPTPIQQAAIPGVIEGRDLLGIAQTGTGKTAAFALPILHRLAADRRPAPRKGARALVLSPTRELATQIADSFRAYGSHLGFTVATVFGGVGHGPQIKALAQGVDIVVAAPGRLLDHLGAGDADLSKLEIFVLDEADQMLDMGFIVPIRQVVKRLPKQRQNLFFSATMPADIEKLAGELLHDPLKVSVAPPATTAERVNQQVVHVDAASKRGLLVELFGNPDFTRVLVFTRTKRGADKVARILEGAGVRASAIHGNKSQNQRERALAEFKSGETRALVATDIAARGIDISAVSHVVQFELPDVPEQYVHRIGRTARAGNEGSAVAFCAGDERQLLRDIEKVTRQKIPAVDRRGDAALAALTAASPEAAAPKVEQRGQPGRRRQQQPHRTDGRGPRNADARKPQREQRNGGSQNQSSAAPASSATQEGAHKPSRGRGRGQKAAGGGSAGWAGVENRGNRNGGQNRNANGEQRGDRGANANTPRGKAQDKKPHRKGQGRNDGRTGTPNAPRGDVMRVSSSHSSGQGMSASDVMKFLSQKQ